VVERGPEKAGVGGSIPSLATTFSTTCSKPGGGTESYQLDPSVTWPLLSGRYEKVIAATYEYDILANQRWARFARAAAC
jgi:hypothetical protein